MKYTVHWVDVGPFLGAGVRPEVALERPLAYGDDPRGGLFNTAEVARKGVYRVPDGGVFDPDLPWKTTSAGKTVRVPVHAYRVSEYSLAAVFALGVQLGAEAASRLAAAGFPEPGEAVMVFGSEVTDLGGAFRAYVGLAFIDKE